MIAIFFPFNAEIGGDHRHGPAAVGARSRVGVDRRDADLAPARGEDVVPVLRARHPELERLHGADLGRRPEEVLADRPAAVRRRPDVCRQPLPERRAVLGVVREVPVDEHLGRMSLRGRTERAVELERHQAVRRPNGVQLDEDAEIQRLQARLSRRLVPRERRRNGDKGDENGGDDRAPGHHPDKIGPGSRAYILPKG
jgi:hypothetical protein